MNRKVCVYGASSNEIDDKYISEVELLGAEIARRGDSVIFGGGARGLMGAVARGASSENGEIIGIAPSFFNIDGILYERCTDFIFTETMRERKQLMEDMSDAFVMTPGGIGTFEEFFEVLTLKQLGRHNKPIAVLNTFGYFDDMLRMLDTAVDNRFMRPLSRNLFGEFTDCVDVLEYIDNYDGSAMNIEQMKFIGDTEKK